MITFWGELGFFTSFWSEVLARKLKKLLHMIFPGYTLTRFCIFSLKSVVTYNSFMTGNLLWGIHFTDWEPRSWMLQGNYPGASWDAQSIIYLQYSLTRCSFISVILCFFSFSHWKAKMLSSLLLFIFFSFIFFFLRQWKPIFWNKLKSVSLSFI